MLQAISDNFPINKLPNTRLAFRHTPPLPPITILATYGRSAQFLLYYALAREPSCALIAPVALPTLNGILSVSADRYRNFARGRICTKGNHFGVSTKQIPESSYKGSNQPACSFSSVLAFPPIGWTRGVSEK